MTNFPTPDRDLSESGRLHERATAVFPGGVSHNVRHEPPHPIYLDRTEGPHVVDVDGNRYVDFWNNHHTSVLGHAPSEVVEAVRAQAVDGLHYGMPNELALELGLKAQEFVPSAERLRFCASGTEATMYAVRLARAFTDRDYVLKVEGGWHGGNTDLSKAVYTPLDAPTTAGLPPGAAEHVRAFPLNDREALRDLLDEHRGNVAAVIIDPRKAGIEPDEEFLAFVDDMRSERGFLFVFDEVVTGFRVSPGSYQARVDLSPDLTTLGKVLGGGLPVGALAGRADLFEAARPDVDVSPHDRVIAGGGTFTHNPMTLAAGLAMLNVLDDEPVYERTERLGDRLRDEVGALFGELGVDGEMLGFSSLVTTALNPGGPLNSPTDVKTRADGDALRRYHLGLCDRGYFFLPGHMGNLTYRHTDEHVDGVVDASREVLAEMQAEGWV